LISGRDDNAGAMAGQAQSRRPANPDEPPVIKATFSCSECMMRLYERIEVSGES